MIVQSLPSWLSTIKIAIESDLPKLMHRIIYSDSFEHALSVTPKDVNLIVITSGMFHDTYFKTEIDLINTVPKSEQNGNKLAQLIKEININAKVYQFSELAPKNIEYLDGFILKIKHDDMNLHKVLRILQKNN